MAVKTSNQHHIGPFLAQTGESSALRLRTPTQIQLNPVKTVKIGPESAVRVAVLRGAVWPLAVARTSAVAVAPLRRAAHGVRLDHAPRPGVVGRGAFAVHVAVVLERKLAALGSRRLNPTAGAVVVAKYITSRTKNRRCGEEEEKKVGGVFNPRAATRITVRGTRRRPLPQAPRVVRVWRRNRRPTRLRRCRGSRVPARR